MNDLEPQNRLRSQRVLLQVAVLVILETKEGHRVCSQGFTQIANAHGGLMEVPSRMIAAQRLTLVNPQSAPRLPIQRE
jgi:hypothetical protein